MKDRQDRLGPTGQLYPEEIKVNQPHYNGVE